MGNALRKGKDAQGVFGKIPNNIYAVFSIHGEDSSLRNKPADGGVEECTSTKREDKKKKNNFLLRAIRDMTKGEKTLLVIAFAFLAINAYTNLNYPKIMGECVETVNLAEGGVSAVNGVNGGDSVGGCNIGAPTKCNFLVTFLQKIKILNNLFLGTQQRGAHAVLCFLPYFICGGVASYFRIYFTNKCIKKVENRLKKRVHKTIITQNSEKFKSHKSPDYLINCVFNEIKFSAKHLITSITQMMRYGNSILGGSISMICISPYLTKLCILVVPTYGFLVLLILRKLKSIKMKTSNSEEKQMARLSDILQKKNVISFFGNDYYENSFFCKNLKYMNRLNDSYTNWESLFYSFLNIGSNIVICSILCFGRSELNKKNMTHGQLVSFIAFSSMLGLGIVGMLKLKKDLGVLQLSLQKIYEIVDFTPMGNNQQDERMPLQRGNVLIHMESPIERDPPPTIGDVNGGDDSPVLVDQCPRNLRGSLKFENVNFAYNAFDPSKRKDVLKNINLEIKEKEKVAIIGKSGSGKSTLWKLLTMEYEYQGNIYIDTYNLKNINKTYFKKFIISVSEQDSSVLNRSLYENLIYALLPVKIEDQWELPKVITMGDDQLPSGNAKSICSDQSRYNDKSSSPKEGEDTSNEKLDKAPHTQGQNCNTYNTRLGEGKITPITEEAQLNDQVNYALLHEYGQDKLNLINETLNELCEQLDLTHFIRSLPVDIHSSIQNSAMSSGQRQRISIIRSLIKDTPIYVFDEITSFLDESNEEKVYNLINTIIPNKTIIYVTHSVNILHQMDKIIIVDQGKICSIGTFSQIKNDPLFLDIFSHSKMASR
ncbi:ABC transporter, putative [Plasmodium knowlesi strain H]|uniref:ABC transporter, putative n=3 Tax=Plasmodium knowlesi TaxID=5850 RepID=A0A5K1UE94_PLAKH|nr:ABC transporter B family member 5, putative [Plasmodium knowlesi strain H]OTN66394.1 putative ABC transporter [Plasmodium knowlesi]CAA9989937.1 ABC transporter B family member 5, putative [Plasmodium knowlesi strain H]SBO24513.1 ABC transporter, putative [Plasmodium knowlesi strain H]SBO26434.1 ABC transporter, putative [Plasmodium knowlesi strain H]VVS79411.1 ABC transporter B family member 5, putative [Plasmodium knowlesi strain H]|eukprot:XP_002259952.1 ABC transporter, putative [Plasmodium knowlesi strain H]